jgi:molecular chaperone IbpA
MVNYSNLNEEFNKFNKYFIGSDNYVKTVQDTLNRLSNTAFNTSYPPFNLKKTEENTYVLEMAVAGFGKQDIEMVLEEDKLTIKGNAVVDSEDDKSYLHKGIANRAFTRSFTLADNVEIRNAKLINGMLKIWLDHIIPEDKKPKKVQIDD